MRDIGKAFSFPFQDPDWIVKFLLGVLFLLLSVFGIGIFIVAGYLVQITHRVMRNESPLLPEWSDIGVKFVIGFKYLLVCFLYLLPAFVLMVPVVILAMVGAATESPEAVSLAIVVYLFGLMLIVLPYSLLFTLLLPTITYRFAANEKMSEALDLPSVLREFKANWQTNTVVALLAVGVQWMAGLGVILLLVGVLFTIFYSYVVSAYLTGALYRERLEAAG
jgi:hypothetical protein